MTTEQKQQQFKTDYENHKKEYMKDHSTKEMVFENGSALAFILKQLEKLTAEIHQLKNVYHANNKKESKQS